MNLPVTEQRNPSSDNIDSLSPLGLLKVINEEDKTIALAVEQALPQIARAVEGLAERLTRGGRLVYVGAGTSGRLGVLDAAECPPTFGTAHGLVVGLIAGGERALQSAIEGSEDNEEQGKLDLQQIGLKPEDVVVGIAASGRTPYVLGALDFARTTGALTVGVSCNPDTPLSRQADIAIEVVVGPEVISGSTRMKSGTAQKMVLNMLSTATMVMLGKTYKNYMVDLSPTNKKLRQRAIRLVEELAGCTGQQATVALQQAEWDVKAAIVMIRGELSLESARDLLVAHQGRVALVLENLPI